jgi:hypothetical protein
MKRIVFVMLVLILTDRESEAGPALEGRVEVVAMEGSTFTLKSAAGRRCKVSRAEITDETYTVLTSKEAKLGNPVEISLKANLWKNCI